MWKYIIGIIVLAIIDNCFEVDPYESIKQKRKKRLPKSLVYLLVAGISYFFYSSQIGGDNWRMFLFILSIATTIFSLGSFLSAINPNLREMFIIMVICAVLAIVIYVLLKDNHFIWFCVLEGFFLLSLILNIIETISNMKDGIDPDVVEADKEAKKKSRRKFFKIAKLIFRAFYS